MTLEGGDLGLAGMSGRPMVLPRTLIVYQDVETEKLLDVHAKGDGGIAIHFTSLLDDGKSQGKSDKSVQRQRSSRASSS